MADSIERIAGEMDEAAVAYAGHHSSGTFRRLATRLRALSPAGGDLHHAVWSMVRPYIQPAAREKVNAALKETLAASPQQEPGAEGLRDAISASLYELSLVGEGREHDEAVAHIEKRITSGQTLAGAGDLDLALDIAISGQEHAITARHAAEERLANAEAILHRVLHDLIAGSRVENETQEALCTFLDPITFPIDTATSAGTTGGVELLVAALEDSRERFVNLGCGTDKIDEALDAARCAREVGK